ncbi:MULTISPECIES: TspO/MBR family protein [Ensifer]|jgi:tryptophan-rich sensory protein|uniref:Tryptophan-rich sensory protein n=1 Tax=Ensifer canadensis TaxID=555315 RepID=A0AAW4FG29_9HYPH|nr:MULTISPECIES: TspO/MBR family protein [Ensifer]MDP9628766.1 tryptophan-rich sensory protein [Ensifer adhaerens]KQU98388.1 sensor histidine kinase [Ensifer sp. Root31]KQW63148.1 sensor histidine kinase [Ensifer sp. Root1252]KQW85164.1 sensor histidine kinase [Ensifer sp. Root127]KQY71076.1 sensor histidine kinase [Ensifer sp. Root142]
MNRPLVYTVFIAAVLGLGLLIGYNNIPGEWYQSLAKPVFNPPNWIFAPVWSVLYVMIGIVGARLFLDHRRTAAMRLWLAQMIFNFLWSPLFFGLQDIASALIVIIALLIAVAGVIVASWQRDRASALLFLPYLAWVAFATVLNGSIFLMN